VDALREMVNHADPTVHAQGVELCLSLGSEAIGSVLSPLQAVEGWLISDHRAWTAARLSLLCETEQPLPAGARRLCIAGVRGTDRLLPQLLARVPGLEALDLSFTDVTDLTPLEAAPSLHAVHLQGCRAAPLDLSPLESLPSLADLCLSDATLDWESLSTLRPARLWLDRLQLPEAWHLPDSVVSLSAEGAALFDQPLDRLVRAGLRQLYLGDARDWHPEDLAGGTLDALGLTFRAPLLGHNLPATRLSVRSDVWRNLRGLVSRFRRLEHLVLHQEQSRFLGISDLGGPLVLDTVRVETPFERGWPRGCTPSLGMFRFRRRTLQPGAAPSRDGAARWRAEGYRWSVLRGPMNSRQRLDLIKAVRRQANWGLRRSKDNTDPLYDETADAYPVAQALRLMGLWSHLGTACRLAPWE